jgi:hypothetical protein
MSGVHVAKSFPPSLGMPARDVQAMQDVLYDILATGLDTEHTVPLDAVEHFLHEHARSAKSGDEFRAFFAQHGLSLTSRAIKPPPVVLPPIARAVQDDPPVAKFPVELAKPEPPPPLHAAFPASMIDAAPFGAPPRRSQPWVWAALILMAGGVSALAYHGYATITRLEHRLVEADNASKSDRVALDELKTKTAGLESEVASSGEEIQRVDDKSNLIIQSLLTEKNRAKGRNSY